MVGKAVRFRSPKSGNIVEGVITKIDTGCPDTAYGVFWDSERIPGTRGTYTIMHCGAVEETTQ